jgi:hypothetical protein
VISLPEREGEEREERRRQLGWVLVLKKEKRWEPRRRTNEMELMEGFCMVVSSLSILLGDETAPLQRCSLVLVLFCCRAETERWHVGSRSTMFDMGCSHCDVCSEIPGLRTR